jgi:penicillin-binding protein 1A
VYAAALERGYTPGTLISGLSAPIMTLQGAWLPDDHSGGGPMTMRSALRLSSNSAAVSTLMDIGIPAAIHTAERFGIESVPGVPSLALGSGEVTLLTMTAAYSVFANGGMRPQPMLIRRVETADGEVLFSAQPRADRAVSETTAFLMTSMLSDVLNAGTGWQARRSGFARPAAGKTGTTNDFRDAWFIGYTPYLATGVWVGYDYPRTIAARGYAATLAAPLWGRFMSVATRYDAPTPFQRPRTVTSVAICRVSGKRATDACRHAVEFDRDGYATERSTVYTEYFARGTEPTEYCDLHTDTYLAWPGTTVMSPALQPQPTH